MSGPVDAQRLPKKPALTTLNRPPRTKMAPPPSIVSWPVERPLTKAMFWTVSVGCAGSGSGWSSRPGSGRRCSCTGSGARPPSSVTRPPPSMTTSGWSLNTLAVAAILMVTGLGPQLNVMTPPLATALTTACEVQLAGVPVPTTWSGDDVSAAPAPAGTVAVPAGLPGAGCGGVTRVTDRARCRKPAVSARVMARAGQKWRLPQLIAAPAVARRLMAVANGVAAWTSVKGPPVAVVSLSALAEERGHAAAGDLRGRAEAALRTRRRDPRGHDLVDRPGLRRPAGDVREVDAARRRQLERADDEHGHVGAADGRLRTEAVVPRRVARGHHASRGHGLDRGWNEEWSSSTNRPVSRRRPPGPRSRAARP